MMNKPIVIEHPKGVFSKIMPGSRAMELYDSFCKGNFGSKSNPGPGSFFKPHMLDLHNKHLKEQGIK